MDRHTDTMLDMRHLQRAARTLAALPVDAFTKPAGVRSCWPEMIRGNYIVVDGTRRAGICRPTSQQIDEMDRIFLCLADLPPVSQTITMGTGLSNPLAQAGNDNRAQPV